MFSVVEFADSEEGSVSIVRSQWFTPRKREIFWPPEKDPEKFVRILKRGDLCDPDTWQLHAVKKCYYETNDYAIAYRKCKKAQVVSDVQTSDTDDNDNILKRKRCPPKRFLNCSTDDEETPSTSRRPPKVSSLNKIQPSNSLSDIENNILTASSCTIGVQSPSTISTGNIDTENRNTREFQVLLNEILKIKEQNKYILNLLEDLRKNPTSKDQNLSTVENLPVSLPLKNVEEVEQFEIYLQNSTHLKNFKSYCSSLVGGKDIVPKTNKVLRSLLNDEVAVSYNYCGQNKRDSHKKAFSKLILNEVVIYVVMADLTENYQLKWHSYSSHLHSCVASALSSESFADVSLFTMDGRHIMAHRFVLSACSQYLHHVLKFQQKVTSTLPLVIVLPPEINYKTIKTLIHYMYSGETTVSKDILESVLKGGDILKVKGLWRPKEDKQNVERSLLKVPEQRNHITKTVVQNTSNNDLNKNEETRSSKLIEFERSESNSSSQIETITDKESKSKKHNTNEEKEQSEKSNSEENMQFLVIKDEPIEWSELEEEEMEMLEDSSMFNDEMEIKPEIVFDESEESTKTEELYSPLTCELCSETFSLPADWVRHIQTHTDMLPAKRQRRGRSNDEDTGSFPPLHCDMCQKYYATPAEWVRHIQSSHTEFELRVSNKTIPTRPVRVNRQVNSTHKMCTMCNKKFPSHASMLIHKRTHTGEKPYMCEHCQKGFNVKSNLLRHLRTLHDRIINSTDIEYRNEDSKNSNTLNVDA